MPTRRDYYEILEVSREVAAAELKSAYRRLALKYHPDRNPNDPEAAEKFKEASEAYAVLSDPDKRQRYDRLGHSGVGGAAGAGFGGFDPSVFADFSDLLGDLFGFSAPRERRMAGSDLVYRMEITLKDAAFGVDAPIAISRLQACPACHGSGAEPGSSPVTCPSCRGRGRQRMSQGFLVVTRPCPECGGEGRIIEKPCRQCGGEGRRRESRKLDIRIPPGVETGSRLRLTGEGDAAPAGGAAGDLYIVVTVAEHEVFERAGDDVVLPLNLPFPTLVLGGEVSVPTLDGEPEKVAIPPGTAVGSEIRIKGQGLGRLGRRGRGDLVIRAGVAVPEKPTAREKELLREYAEEIGAPVGGKSVLDKAKKIFK
jgi:molecular chaperone DnaJ